MRYVIGRKGVGYYRFRRIEVAGSWTGFSEQPSFSDARDATDTVVGALSATSRGRVPRPARHRRAVGRLHPLRVDGDAGGDVGAGLPGPGRRGPRQAEADAEDRGPQPAYEFEPEPARLISALLPRYISARIYSALLESATSESAARRRAMKSASDNATDLIRTYTRLANQARQAEITQEISEIVGGADALASAGSEER